MSIVYFIIFLLFFAYISWTWISTRTFVEMPTRISFMLIGTLFVIFITFILFTFSSIGVDYPRQEMLGQVRKMILLVFVPINGFIILPQVINLISSIKEGALSKDETERKLRIISIIFIVLVIFECIYFKNIQSGIINYINTK